MQCRERVHTAQFWNTTSEWENQQERGLDNIKGSGGQGLGKGRGLGRGGADAGGGAWAGAAAA